MASASADNRGRLVNPLAGRDVSWLLDYRAATRGAHPFLVWEPFEGERQVWTYAGFRDRVQRVAAGLAKRGVKAGDAVLVHLDNAPELEFLWFAVQRLGAVVVTTNTRSSAEELAYFADNCGAVGAVTSPEHAALVAANARGIKWLAVTEHMIEGGAPPVHLAPDKSSSFSSIEGDAAALPQITPDPWRPGSVQYTSGTTSRPKGVLWTHGNALWGAQRSAVHEGLTASDVHHTVMPSFHTNARTYSILPTMWVGGTVVLQPRFSASRFWDVALRNRCTWASTIMFMYKALMRHPVPEHHHFRMWGSSMNETPFDQHFRVRTIGWWGMTETITQGIVGDAATSNRSRTTGRPAAGYDIRILRDDLVTPVEPGETGHLQVRGMRGIQLFLEYLGNARVTSESFTGDGWFVTGDRMTFECDGMLTFADRDKDMLKVGGENVAASEIERVIAAVDGVHEVAVVAQKHAMLDEVPVAFVIPSPEMREDEWSSLNARILAGCEARLADFKRPRHIHIVTAMPRSTLEKVNKAELRKGLPTLK